MKFSFEDIDPVFKDPIPLLIDFSNRGKLLPNSFNPKKHFPELGIKTVSELIFLIFGLFLIY